MYASLTVAYLAVAGLLKLAHEDYSSLAKRPYRGSSASVSKVKRVMSTIVSKTKKAWISMGQYPLQ